MNKFFKKLASRALVSSLGLSLCLGALATSFNAHAAHGAYNPMMPRQLSEEAATADYAYGYSILPGHAIDTLEGPNRYMWYVNYDIFDHYILRPVAHGYAMLPQGFQDGVGNFLSNLGEVNNAPNNLLVGNFGDAGVSVGRFVINSTVGVLGIFDVASHIGLQSAPMSMSTVLGKAGVDQGPYIMVPAYGPVTARSANGDAIDGLPFYFISWPVIISKWVVSGVHNRAQLIDQEAVLDNSIDPYVSARDIYLMYSNNKVNPLSEGEIKPTDELDQSVLDDIDSIDE